MSNDKQGEPGFASRWSRLKQEAKTEPLEVEPEAAATEPEAPADDRPDEEVLEELGLPDPDTLKPGDNFSAFMAKAVPTRLRNRALRMLWISDPVLANLDELLDYGEDFTDAATVIENMQTAYQVGKGYVDKVAALPEEDAGSVEEPAEDSEETAEEPEETSEKNGADEADEADSTDSVEQVAPETAPEETFDTAVDTAVPGEKIPVRPRMRFRLAKD